MSGSTSIGISGTHHADVTDLDTAISLRSGDVPVLATPRIIAWMEAAAVAALADLPEPMTSVGIHIAIDHIAPTLVGAAVRCEAVVCASEGPRVEFEVQTFVGDQIVASGTHTRVIVDRRRFLARAGLATED